MVNSLVADIIMPCLALISPSQDGVGNLNSWFVVMRRGLSDGPYVTMEQAKEDGREKVVLV